MNSRYGYGSLTEMTGVPGTGTEVLRNSQKLRVLWHGTGVQNSQKFLAGTKRAVSVSGGIIPGMVLYVPYRRRPYNEVSPSLAAAPTWECLLPPCSIAKLSSNEALPASFTSERNASMTPAANLCSKNRRTRFDLMSIYIYPEPNKHMVHPYHILEFFNAWPLTCITSTSADALPWYSWRRDTMPLRAFAREQHGRKHEVCGRVRELLFVALKHNDPLRRGPAQPTVNMF